MAYGYVRNDGYLGPIDFQTREPVSPLFAALPHTNIAIEVQTVQEYTGQQRHMVFLPSMWKWVLDTDMRAGGRSTPVKSIVEGKAFPLPDGKPLRLTLAPAPWVCERRRLLHDHVLLPDLLE